MRIYGSDEQIVNNKLNDEELLQLFHKVQQLKEDDIKSVKAMLKAFVFQKDYTNYNLKYTFKFASIYFD